MEFNDEFYSNVLNSKPSSASITGSFLSGGGGSAGTGNEIAGRGERKISSHQVSSSAVNSTAIHRKIPPGSHNKNRFEASNNLQMSPLMPHCKFTSSNLSWIDHRILPGGGDLIMNASSTNELDLDSGIEAALANKKGSSILPNIPLSEQILSGHSVDNLKPCLNLGHQTHLPPIKKRGYNNPYESIFEQSDLAQCIVEMYENLKLKGECEIRLVNFQKHGPNLAMFSAAKFINLFCLNNKVAAVLDLKIEKDSKRMRNSSIVKFTKPDSGENLVGSLNTHSTAGHTGSLGASTIGSLGSNHDSTNLSLTENTPSETASNSKHLGVILSGKNDSMDRKRKMFKIDDAFISGLDSEQIKKVEKLILNFKTDTQTPLRSGI